MRLPAALAALLLSAGLSIQPALPAALAATSAPAWPRPATAR